MKLQKRYSTHLLIFFFITIISNVSADQTSKRMPLSQIQLLRKVCENNFEIRYQKYDLQIAAEQVKKETAIFEPNLSASFNYKDSVTPNTAEKYFDRMFQDTFKERLKQYQLGLKGLLPTGTVLGLDYTIDDISNDLVDEKPEYKKQGIHSETASYLGFQITQPLLKNRGAQSTLAKIRIAQTAQNMAYQGFRKQVMDIVHNALNAYWELYYTTKQFYRY